jgi:hypothetical protein
MEEPVKSPLEQLADVGDGVEKNWERVVAALRAATLELIPDLSDEDKLLLEENFWHVHLKIMQRAELFQPGIAEAIISRSEEINRQIIDAEQAELPSGNKLRTFGRGILKGFFGPK